MPISHSVVYTVGHGNRDLDGFIALLRAAGIQTLVDIRAYPQSRRFPHFNRDALREAVETADMVYHWAGRSLGGNRRCRSDSPHRALPEGSLRGFADHMESETFLAGVGQLLRLASQSRLVLMCAERLPENCHRNLLSDYLLLNGRSVWHLIDSDERREHLLSPAARRESRRLVYDRFTDATLDLRH